MPSGRAYVTRGCVHDHSYGMTKTPLQNLGYQHNIRLKDMTDEEIRIWGRSIAEDNVIILEDQDLSKDDLIRIYYAIGVVLVPNREFFCDDQYPQLMRVTNERKDGEKIGLFADKELDWHSNANGRDAGTECCVALYCVRPGEGTVTSFVDTRQAYNDLHPAWKKEVDNITCLFKFENNTFYDLDDDDKELEMFRNRGFFKNGVVKPLVYTHPYDHTRGLYFPFHYIREMYGNSQGFDEIMEFLKQHIFQQKYMYHHSWKAGDLCFMDQYHSLHRRNAVQGDRLLYRSSLDYEKSWS